MKAVSIKIIKDELSNRTDYELKELCLQLAKFKKENKELLTYLLFDSDDEQSYVENIKHEINELFEQINIKSFFYIRKSVRKILTLTKKYIRYSKNKETEIELLLYFCTQLKEMKPSINKSAQLQNTYSRQLQVVKSLLKFVHEDLQYDYMQIINELEKNYSS